MKAMRHVQKNRRGIMSSLKFNEVDREKVIIEIEKHFRVKLRRIGNRKKLLVDHNKKTYWVFGGYKTWHGIPSEMLKDEQRNQTNGELIIATRDGKKIDIFAGPLQKLIENARELSRTQKGDFQFNIDIRGDRLLIKEISGLVLGKIVTFVYEDKSKDEDNKNIKKDKVLKRLTPEKIKILLKSLKQLK